MNFRDTLSEKDAHLARRLEGFGDVVFGFSVSQLALQLNLPRTTQDLVGDPIRYFLYFATFAALAGFWLRFHRMIAGAFRPAPADLVTVFFYLAFVGLVPYALYANSHFAINGSLEGSRLGLATYLLCVTMLSLSGTVVQFRNFRRGYLFFDDVERRKAWQSTVTGAAIVLGCGFSLMVDLTAGIRAGALSTFGIALAAAVGRRAARVPSAAFLRIRDVEGGANPAEAAAG
jgi:uncharacterized membrane protein